MNDMSVLAAQRAEDEALLIKLERGVLVGVTEQPAVNIHWSDGTITPCGPSQIETRQQHPDGVAAAARIRALSQELAEASHDRDRYQADLERLRKQVQWQLV